MSVQIAPHQLKSLAEKGERALARLQTMKRKSTEIADSFFATVEVGAASFAGGFVMGRYGGVEVGGISVDLGLGVIGKLVELSGMVGEKNSAHVGNISNGLLACHFTTLGAGVGRKALAKHNATAQVGPTQSTQGLPSADRYTAEQLANMADRFANA